MRPVLRQPGLDDNGYDPVYQTPQGAETSAMDVPNRDATAKPEQGVILERKRLFPAESHFEVS
jgi:hypothetical protein